MAPFKRVTPMEAMRPIRQKDITAVATPRASGGGWTSPLIYGQVEVAPQAYTIGDGIHSSFGPGTDDTVHWPTEEAPPATGITPTWDYDATLGMPARAAWSCTDEIQLYEDFPELRARRGFLLANTGGGGATTSVTIWQLLLSEMYIISQDQREMMYIIPARANPGADDVAIAVVEPDNDAAEFVAFVQDAGVVTAYGYSGGPEPRSQVHAEHLFQTQDVDGGDVTSISLTDTLQVATGGKQADTAGWVGAPISMTSDLFFSSMHAVTLEDRKVLLFHLTSGNTLNAYVISYEGGVLSVDNVTQVGTGIVNIYQPVTADNGLEGGDRSRMVMTCRTSGAGTGRAYVLSANGDGVAVEASASLSADYSHAAWCRDRIVVMTKPGYNAGGSVVGWGTSTITLTVRDQNLTVLSTSTVSTADVASGIQQTATVHGWDDGRLFLHASSCEPADSRVGHTYEYDGSGIRLYYLSGDSLVLNDQTSEMPGIKPASIELHRFGEDSVFALGRTGETYGGPPGDEQPLWTTYFVGGVQKECNSDLEVFRMSDEWVITVEPYKNSYWLTVASLPQDVSPDLLEATYVRAHHIDSTGDIDVIGEPVIVHVNGNWYNKGCRVDDTHFMTLSRGYDDPLDFVNNAAMENLLKVYEVAADGTITQVSVSTPAAVSDWVFFAGLVQTTDDSGLYVAIGRASDLSLVAATFRLGDGNVMSLVDYQVLVVDPEGPGFPERNPYGITQIDENRYVATWVRTISSSHFSGHTGFVVNGAGAITVGTTLDPEADNLRYGFQGTWMAQGCGLADGRFAYPVFNEWFGSSTKFPTLTPDPLDGSGSLVQRKPCAIMICEVGDAGELTPAMYPLRVDPESLDDDTRSWYEETGYFDPIEYTRDFITPIPRANNRGYQHLYWNISKCLPSPTPGYLWMWQGQSPVPFPHDLEGQTFFMAQYEIDEENEELVFVPGTWAFYANAYFAPYGNSACVIEDGLFACIGHLNYQSRLSPQGYNGAYGTLTMRIFRAGNQRGDGTVVERDHRVRAYVPPQP